MRRTLLFAAPLLLAAARVAQACPNCKEGAGNEAFQWGILLMIGGVITVVGSLAVFIARLVHKLDAAQAADAELPQPG
jgi:hypothetical protein